MLASSFLFTSWCEGILQHRWQILFNRFGQTSKSDFRLHLEPIKLRSLNVIPPPVCVSVWKSSPLSLSRPLCLLLWTVTKHHVAAILSPLDLPYRAIVVLSESSCSFGSENSVKSILQAEVVMRYPGSATERNKPRGCDAIICFFWAGGDFSVWNAGRILT